MGSPYIGEVRLVPYSFAPLNWAFCQGQLQAISSNEALYNLIGTLYGGDGQTTFALPDLRGRVPVHQGQGPGLSIYTIGQVGGTESVTVTTQQMPSHTHIVYATTNASGTGNNPSNNVVANGLKMFAASGTPEAMSPNMIGLNSGGLPHENRQPFLTMSWVIALEGIYPTQ